MGIKSNFTNIIIAMVTAINQGIELSESVQEVTVTIIISVFINIVFISSTLIDFVTHHHLLYLAHYTCYVRVTSYNYIAGTVTMVIYDSLVLCR